MPLAHPARRYMGNNGPAPPFQSASVSVNAKLGRHSRQLPRCCRWRLLVVLVIGSLPRGLGIDQLSTAGRLYLETLLSPGASQP